MVQFTDDNEVSSGYLCHVFVNTASSCLVNVLVIASSSFLYLEHVLAIA